MIDTFSIRCKLIDLALSGMLSEQYTNEVVTFEHNESKKWTMVSEEEKYYTIPANWKYLRVGEISVINPKNDIDDEKEVSFIPMACVQDGFSNKHTSKIKQWKYIKKGFVHFIDGDIGVAKISPCFQNRKSVIFKELNNGYGAGTTELTIIRPEVGIVSAEYMLYFFQSALFINKGIESFTGVVGQQRIHKDYIKTSPIPLPPYDEQIRIVDKLNTAFEILDTIEDLQSQYVADFKVLKSKIIDAGIQGKLTKQISGDEDVKLLYQRLKEEKKIILKNRKGREDRNIKEVNDDVPFELPDHWKWVRLGEIGLFKKGPFGSALTKSMFVPKSDDTIKVYEQQHAIKKDANLGTYYITKEYFDEKMSGFEVEPGDILVSCAGTIGETYILPEDIEQGIINQALMRVILVDSVDKRFFQFYFDASLKMTARKESNGSAIKNIPPFAVMKNWYFPLPPIEEQKRIVEKIDELLSFV